MRSLKQRLGQFIRHQVREALSAGALEAADHGPLAQQLMALRAQALHQGEALDALRNRAEHAERMLQALLATTTDWRRMRPASYVGDGRVLTVTNRGDRMYLDGKDIMISTGVLCWGGWEDNTTTLLERFLRPGMVWADVGANCGYFTVIGHKLVRANGAAGETYAFEVSPTNAQLCADNLALTWMAEGSRVEHMGIYSEDRTLTFQIYAKWGVNSGLARGGDTADGRPVEVPATTLDSYFLCRARRPDFIKIDIEGGEWHALSGARGLIEAQPDLRLLVEWSPDQLRACGTEPRMLAELIPALGLRCFHAEADMAPLSVEDCLAIPRTTMLLLSRSDLTP